MNTNTEVYEWLKEEGIIHSKGIDVTFVRDSSYASDVMLYGHGLKRDGFNKSIETIIPLDDLYALENKTFDELVEWISIQTESLLVMEKTEKIGEKTPYKKKLFNLLSGIKSTCRGIIVNGESREDLTADTTRVAQNIAKKL